MPWGKVLAVATVGWRGWKPCFALYDSLASQHISCRLGEERPGFLGTVWEVLGAFSKRNVVQKVCGNCIVPYIVILL